MDYTQGYDCIFDQAAGLEGNFASFRSDPKYHFAVTPRHLVSAPDYEALGKALDQNPSVAALLRSLPKPDIGYKDLAFCPCDGLDSRHIMMLSHLTRHIDHPIPTVMEIGGGYGNWAWLAHSCEHLMRSEWTIIDLPWMLELQRWFLNQMLPDLTHIHFIPTHEVASQPQVEVLIAAHSLSELTWDVFQTYADTCFPRATYLYYSTHLKLPNPALVNRKLNEIYRYFEPIDILMSEGGLVANIVFQTTT